jgi:hypothetical protein
MRIIRRQSATQRALFYLGDRPPFGDERGDSVSSVGTKMVQPVARNHSSLRHTENRGRIHSLALTEVTAGKSSECAQPDLMNSSAAM